MNELDARPGALPRSVGEFTAASLMHLMFGFRAPSKPRELAGRSSCGSRRKISWGWPLAASSLSLFSRTFLSGLFSAMHFRAKAMAVSLNFPSGASSSTRPISRHCLPGTCWPLVTISSAFLDAGDARQARCVPPAPREQADIHFRKTASRARRPRRDNARTSATSRPPPSVVPMDRGDRPALRRSPRSPLPRPSNRLAPFIWLRRTLEMSAPAMKVLPSQISTIAFTSRIVFFLPDGTPRNQPVAHGSRQRVHRRRIERDDGDLASPFRKDR